jgi:RNA polymerase sigma factor (sigma-70 family)
MIPGFIARQRFRLLSYLMTVGHKLQDLTEKEIIQGCTKKDAVAQHRLFLDYAPKLMTICRRYACDPSEAEDMLQDAFMRIFKYIHQYHSTGSFEGWLKRITVNAAIHVLQGKKIRFLDISDTSVEIHTPAPDIYSDLSTEDLLKLISRLPDGYRMIFNLHILEGYSHDEISRMLHIKPATSRSQLSKARNMLKEQINSLQKITG